MRNKTSQRVLFLLYRSSSPENCQTFVFGYVLGCDGARKEITQGLVEGYFMGQGLRVHLALLCIFYLLSLII